MVEESNAWVPPPMTVGAAGIAKTAAQGGGGRRRPEEARPLSEAQRDRFEDCLRRLTMAREDICAAMMFALEMADSGAARRWLGNGGEGGSLRAKGAPLGHRAWHSLHKGCLVCCPGCVTPRRPLTLDWPILHPIPLARTRTPHNGPAAAEVAEILSDALTLPETPIPLKVARLFLLSDILHNSTAPVRNASRFRVCIQPLLPDIFLGLQVSRSTCLRGGCGG